MRRTNHWRTKLFRRKRGSTEKITELTVIFLNQSKESIPRAKHPRSPANIENGLAAFMYLIEPSQEADNRYLV